MSKLSNPMRHVLRVLAAGGRLAWHEYRLVLFDAGGQQRGVPRPATLNALERAQLIAWQGDGEWRYMAITEAGKDAL